MLLKKGQLYDVVRHLARLVGRNSSARHTHALIVADGQTASFTATNGVTWLRGSIPCEGTLRAYLPVHELRDFAKVADREDRESMVELMPVADQQVVVAAECMMITLDSRPSGDFPPAPSVSDPDGHEAVWRASAFKRALRWVVRAVSTDDTRPQLCGVFLDGHKLVATDGHRLHVADMPGLPGGPALFKSSDIDLLIGCLPRAGEVSAVRAGELVRFCTEGWELTVRTSPETFPPYQIVIPKPEAQASAVTFRRTDLLRTLKRLPRAGAEVRIDGAWDFHVEETGTRASVRTLNHSGPEISLHLDLAYLRDAVEAGAEIATARFSEPLDPITVQSDGGFLAVVMPRRG